MVMGTARVQRAARVLAAAVAIAGKSDSAAVAASCGGSMNKGGIKPDEQRCALFYYTVRAPRG